MAKRALIADSDEIGARKQAAILGEAGWETSIFDGEDVIDVIATNPPDVLFLRHERRGQNGLALIGRIRQQLIAPGTAMVLVTSDLSSEAIEKHRSRGLSADAYVRLPLSRAELIAAAEAMPEVHDPEELELQIDQDSKAEFVLPPRTPHHSVPASAGALSLKADDVQFVSDVFASIEHVSPDAIVTEALSEQDLTGVERKVAVLRKSLQEREREIAKLAQLWKTREGQLRQTADTYENRETYIEGLKLRIEELEKDIEAAEARLTDAFEDFGSERRESYDDSALREAAMIQEVAKIETELHEVKRERRRLGAQREKETSELTQRIFDWERAYHQLQAFHASLHDNARQEISRLENQIEDRELSRSFYTRALQNCEETVARQRRKLAFYVKSLQEASHLAAEKEASLLHQGDLLFLTERNRKCAAERENAEYRSRLFDAETGWYSSHSTLAQHEIQRGKDARASAFEIGEGRAERKRLLTEVGILRQEKNALSHRLSSQAALSEATIHHLWTTSDRERWVTALQVPSRDEEIFSLRAEHARMEVVLRDAEESLANEELEHATQRARADDAERDLADGRRDSAERLQELRRELEQSQFANEQEARAKARADAEISELRRTLTHFSSDREDSAAQAQARIDELQHQLQAQSAKNEELDYNINMVREDLVAQRRVVDARDERIDELMSSLRDADANAVRLEGIVDRQTTQMAELVADRDAKGDFIASLEGKIAERDGDKGSLEVDKEKLHQQILTLEQEIQRREREEVRLQGAVENAEAGRRSVEEIVVELRGEIEAISAARQADKDNLSRTKTEVDSGGLLIDQLQKRVDEAESGRTQLRVELEQLQIALVEAREERRLAKAQLDEEMTKRAQSEAGLSAREFEVNAFAERASEAEFENQQVQKTLAELETHREEAAALRSKNDALERTLLSKDVELQGLANAVDDLGELRIEYTNTLHREKELSAALDGLRSKFGEAQNEIARLAELAEGDGKEAELLQTLKLTRAAHTEQRLRAEKLEGAVRTSYAELEKAKGDFSAEIETLKRQLLQAGVDPAKNDDDT